MQKAVSDRQMPKIEYRRIEIDDYSKYKSFSLSQKSKLGLMAHTCNPGTRRLRQEDHDFGLCWGNLLP